MKWDNITDEELLKLQKAFNSDDGKTRRIGFTGYFDYPPEEAEELDEKNFCKKCDKENSVLVPKMEFYNRIRPEENVHMWYHVRCSICGNKVAMGRY